MINRRTERRLCALERILTPPEKWQITAKFTDGHIEVMSAEQYKAVKLSDPDSVRIIGRKITNNLRELGAWLDMVKALAFLGGDEEMEADVVILADGVNSPLAQSLGMKKELAPAETAVGVKEVIKLEESVIRDRFNLTENEGLAWMMAGYPSDGGMGGVCLYTNKESLSLALVLTTSFIGQSEYSVPQLFERAKQHPVIAPLIEGGKLLEYSAHLVTEGGYNMLPTLYGDGVLLVGDAANFVMNLAYTVRGMDQAIESGRLAAETVIKAKEKGDFSASTLSGYKQMLENSFVMRDLRHHMGTPKMMEHKELFTSYPAMAQDIMSEMFTIDGNPRRHLMKFAMPAVKKSGGIFKLARVGMDAMKAL